MINPKDLFMLCESIPTNDKEQLQEYCENKSYIGNIKYDGERCIMIKTSDKLIMLSRGGNVITYKFDDITEDINCEDNFIIDGEIISIDGDFGKLQSRALTQDRNKIKNLIKTIPVTYKVFDILSLNDKVLMNEPLSERLEYLDYLFKKNFDKAEVSHIEKCEYGDINKLLNEVIEKEGEGIIVKDLSASYENGKRSKAWLKYKLFKETTITITSFTENPKGIKGETDDGIVKVQISGRQADEVKREFENNGYATINIQYLSQSENGKFRFPSFRNVVSKLNEGLA